MNVYLVSREAWRTRQPEALYENWSSVVHDYPGPWYVASVEKGTTARAALRTESRGSYPGHGRTGAWELIQEFVFPLTVVPPPEKRNIPRARSSLYVLFRLQPGTAIYEAQAVESSLSRLQKKHPGKWFPVESLPGGDLGFSTWGHERRENDPPVAGEESPYDAWIMAWVPRITVPEPEREG